MVFNATFSNISAISWRPVSVVEEGGVPGENHRSWASNGSTLSLAAASGVHPFLSFRKLGANSLRIGDRLVWVVRSNDLTHWATQAPCMEDEVLEKLKSLFKRFRNNYEGHEIYETPLNNILMTISTPHKNYSKI